MLKKIKIILSMMIVVLFITACSPSNADQKVDSIEENPQKTIYTSIYPIYDFTQKIAGDAMKVELLVPLGADPHGWEPSVRAVANVEKGQGLFYNGLDLDPWAEKLAQSMSNKDIYVLAVGEIDPIKPMEFKEEHDHHHDHSHDHHHDHSHDHHHDHSHDHHHDHCHDHGIYDPHIWLDPTIAEEMSKAIKDALVEIDPQNQEYYKENFKTFQQELKKLDEEYKEALSQVSKKEFVVTHAAFGYLANRYGLHQISVGGLAPQAEPSPAKLAEITTIIRKNNINTIFFENLSSPKLAQVLSNETGAKIDTLIPLDGLTQEEIEEGKEYLSVMRENLDKLVESLEEE